MSKVSAPPPAPPRYDIGDIVYGEVKVNDTETAGLHWLLVLEVDPDRGDHRGCFYGVAILTSQTSHYNKKKLHFKIPPDDDNKLDLDGYADCEELWPIYHNDIKHAKFRGGQASKRFLSILYARLPWPVTVRRAKRPPRKR